MADALTEKLISSELIYDGRVVHLYVDTVQLPNGKTSKRELIRHVGAVALVTKLCTRAKAPMPTTLTQTLTMIRGARLRDRLRWAVLFMPVCRWGADALI